MIEILNIKNKSELTKEAEKAALLVIKLNYY